MADFEELLLELRAAHAQAIQQLTLQKEAIAAELNSLRFSSQDHPDHHQVQVTPGHLWRSIRVDSDAGRSPSQLMPEPKHRSPAPELDSPIRLMAREESPEVRFQLEQADHDDGNITVIDESMFEPVTAQQGSDSPHVSERRSIHTSQEGPHLPHLHQGSLGSLSKRISRSLRVMRKGFARRGSSASTSSMMRSLGFAIPGNQPQGIRDPDRVRSSNEQLLRIVKDAAPKITTVFQNGSEEGAQSTRITWQTAFGKNPSSALRTRSWAECLRASISSFAFEAFCIFIILLHAVSVGIEVSKDAVSIEVPGWMKAVDAFILTWYCFEFVLRVWADRCTQNLWWNWFDFVMLVICITDFAMNARSASPSSNYSVMRFMRFMRVTRILKMLKIGKIVNSYFLVFSKMTFCLRQSLPSLLSSCIVIAVFSYICAVILTQSATLYKEDSEDAMDEIGLEEHYGSLDRTFYSLIKAILNGQSWGELMQPLTYVGSGSTFVFVFYVIVTLLCLLNVVQGVFVDSALQSTAHYKDLMVAEAQRKRIILLSHLREVFHEIDTDGSGFITVQEFEACLTTPGGRAFFEVMGLSTVEAYDLFKLIDADGSQTVGIDEFCNGCLRFMGEAKNFDMQCIITENRQLLSKWHTFIENFESCIRTNLRQAVRTGFRDNTPSALHAQEIGQAQNKDINKDESDGLMRDSTCMFQSEQVTTAGTAMEEPRAPNRSPTRSSSSLKLSEATAGITSPIQRPRMAL